MVLRRRYEIERRIDVVLYGADRKQWHSGDVTWTLRRIDSDGIKHMSFRTTKGCCSRHVCNSSRIRLNLNPDMRFDAGQTYYLIAEAAGHHGDFRALKHRSFSLVGGGIEQVIRRMILIPTGSSSDDSSNVMNGFKLLQAQRSPLVDEKVGIRRKQWDCLAPDAQMALLNIEAKLAATRIGGTPLIDSVTGLWAHPKTKEAAVLTDRIYVMMQPRIKAKVAAPGSNFRSASGHGARQDLELPEHPHSWKHQAFPRGNLQLSFSEDLIEWPRGNPNGKQSYSVDADIDLEKGLSHLWEVLVNGATDRTTNQRVVYNLLYRQNILPEYTLNQRSSG